MSGGVDEEYTAVYTRVRDEPVSHCGELLSQVRGVLVFDLRLCSAAGPKSWENAAAHVFDNRVPTALIVDLVAVSGRINDV